MLNSVLQNTDPSNNISTCNELSQYYSVHKLNIKETKETNKLKNKKRIGSYE